MLDIPAAIDAWVAGPAEPAFPDHEFVKGWGVFGLPFDSGHVLALRVFPHSTFGPYHTLWHRDPSGSWSIHVDGPALETACPRYYGPAVDHAGFAHIGLEWTGPASLQVTVDETGFDWRLTATQPPVLAALNAVAPAMPTATWRPRSLLRARELMARSLGMGRLELSGVMPSGHVGTLMPQKMFLVDEARAELDGEDFGRPVQLSENPTIGAVPLPARGVLSIGQAVWEPLPARAPAQT